MMENSPQIEPAETPLQGHAKKKKLNERAIIDETATDRAAEEKKRKGELEEISELKEKLGVSRGGSSFMDMPEVKEIAAQYGSLIDFLEEVFEKDQSDPSHLKNAHECYEMLNGRQTDFIGTPIEADFWNAMSFEAFHMAQGEAFQGNNEESLRKLDIAFSCSQKGFSRSWEAYVKGTVCYFKKDLEGLKKQIPDALENSNVLKSLLNGLESRGSISYPQDYENMKNF